MQDAENLTKLLGHLTPDQFRQLMLDEFGEELPATNAKDPKKAQRGILQSAIESLPVAKRQRMEEFAEKIICLTDGPGQDVVDGFRDGIFDDKDRQAFDALRNQYERAAWLSQNAESVFKEALDARQADVFRQSTACYSGFLGPQSLTVNDDTATCDTFHQAVATQLGCPKEDVAVQIFKRLRPDTQTGEDVALYQVSIHHNRPPELIDCVQQSELVPQEVVRAVASHITYEPTNGHLEVLSRDPEGREQLARLFADNLLKSPITGEHVPIKQYDYQSLAGPRFFDTTGENVGSVKVTELGYAVGNRSLTVKVWATDPEDIYKASKSLVAPNFDFRQHTLNYARLSIRLKKIGKERARSISVVLRDGNRCNIKTKREKDRALCDRLLAKWGLVKEIGNVPVQALAA